MRAATASGASGRGVVRHRAPQAGLLASTGLSVGANAMVGVLVPLLLLERTGSPAAAGLAGAAAFAAAVPALLVGGSLIDRWGRRRVSVAADLLSAAAVAALPVVDAAVGLTLGWVVALVALGAAFDGPGYAARETLRPDVARRAGVPLEQVNARAEAMDGIGSVAGPAAAGVGVALLGGVGMLWVAAVLLVLAALVTWLGVPAAGSVPPGATPGGSGAAVPGRLTDGLRLVVGDGVLRAVAVTGMLVMLFVAPLVLVLADAARRAGAPEQAGLVVAALSGGLVVGALAAGALRLGRRPLLLGALALASTGLVALGLVSGSAAGAGAVAAVVGLAFGPVNPVLAVLTQERTPEHLRGRVVGALASLTLLASPAGTLLAGASLEALGPGPTLVLSGAGCLLATGYAALTPALRRIERTDLTEVPHGPTTPVRP